MTKTFAMIVFCIVLFMVLSGFESVVDGEPLTSAGLAMDFAEAILIFGAVALTALTVLQTREMLIERSQLLDKVEKAQFEGTQWRQLAGDYLKGVGEAIVEQFEAWDLTASESEIAMLILKGFSNNEIAALRNTSKATVRQQASSIYAKSGLSNHRELSAYFLEDLTPKIDTPQQMATKRHAFEPH